MPDDPLKSDLCNDPKHIREDIRLVTMAARRDWGVSPEIKAAIMDRIRRVLTEGDGDGQELSWGMFERVCKRVAEFDRLDLQRMKMILEEERAREAGPSETVVRIEYGEPGG